MTTDTRTPVIIQADKSVPARYAESVSDAQTNLHVHADAYSTEGFWDKVSKVAKKAGKTVLNPAFRMYFAAQDSDTPIWARTTIYGALGYFISPIDALPDFTPLCSGQVFLATEL